MDFKRLADIKNLHEKTLAAARAEKAATFYLLECLHEVDSSRAHLQLSYPSLFDYVHRALGYSESQSYERIASMRLAFKIPEVGASLKRGDLTLTSVARIAQHSKREQLSSKATAELAKALAHRSVREVEKVLASKAQCPPPAREVLKPISESASMLTITIDSEFEALLNEAKALEADPGLSLAEVLKRALQMRVDSKKKTIGWRSKSERSREKQRRATLLRTSGLSQASSKEKSPQTTGEIRSTWKTPSIGGTHRPNGIVGERIRKARRYTPITTRQMLWNRSFGQCTFVSPINNMRCPSRQSLQVDHKLAFALGGSNQIENLQHLCAAHNRVKGMT